MYGVVHMASRLSITSGMVRSNKMFAYVPHRATVDPNTTCDGQEMELVLYKHQWKPVD